MSLKTEISRWCDCLNSPDRIPPADWKTPCWRHDPTSGRWTARPPCGQPEEPHTSQRGSDWSSHRWTISRLTWERNAGYKQEWLTPPLSHLTLTLMASDMPFSARPSPLPADRADPMRSSHPDVTHQTWRDWIPVFLPCSQPWRRSCCSANFKPRLFSSTTSAICLKIFSS